MANNDLARVVLGLSAEVTQLRRDMKKAEGIVAESNKGMQRSTEQAARKMDSAMARATKQIGESGKAAFLGLGKGALAAVASTLTVGAAIAGTRKALDDFGATADRAAATGFDVEFLQAIEHGASLAGVEINTLSSALTTFSKNAGLAVEGKGRMVTTLKELDPALLENIRNATTQEQRLKLVTDALAKETDAARKAAIATAAFGDSGTKIAAAFSGGAAQIDEIVTKARALGLVVDREVIARADELGDELDTVSQVVNTKLNQAFVNLGPVLVWLTGRVADMAGAVGDLVDGMQSLEHQSTRSLEGQLGALDASKNMPNPLGLPTDVFGVDAAKRAEIMDELRRRAMDSLRTQLTNKPPTTPALPTLEDTASRDAAARKAVQQAEAVKQLIDNLQFEHDLIGATDRQREIETALRQAGAAATDAQRQKIEQLVGATYDAKAANEALADSIAEIADIGQTALRGFIDDLIAGKSAGEAFGSVLGNIGNKLLDMGINSLFAPLTGGNPLGGHLGSTFSFGGAK